MRAILLISFLVLLWVASLCLAQAESPGKKLIPVKPSYHEATYVPHAEEPAADPTLPPPPTPREQMYSILDPGQNAELPYRQSRILRFRFHKEIEAAGRRHPDTGNGYRHP